MLLGECKLRCYVLFSVTRHIVYRKTHVTRNGRLAESEENRTEGDCSFGPGWKFEWTLTTKAELTAENKPAYRNR